MKEISTKRLDLIPNIDELNKKCKQISILDYIFTLPIGPLFGKRRWISPYDGWGYMSGGNNFFQIYFDENGALILGHWSDSTADLYRASEKILPGLVEDLPSCFSKYLNAFHSKLGFYVLTYCIWRKNEDNNWNIGNIDFSKKLKIKNFDYDSFDGSEQLLYIFDGNPETYIEWLRDESTYGLEDIEIDMDIVKHIYDYKPIDKEFLKKIEPYLSDENKEIIAYAIKIGYPCS
jgi:hypothetical protein